MDAAGPDAEAPSPSSDADASEPSAAAPEVAVPAPAPSEYPSLRPVNPPPFPPCVQDHAAFLNMPAPDRLQTED